jgi:hypothetical protein
VLLIVGYGKPKRYVLWSVATITEVVEGSDCQFDAYCDG